MKELAKNPAEEAEDPAEEGSEGQKENQKRLVISQIQKEERFKKWMINSVICVMLLRKVKYDKDRNVPFELALAMNEKIIVDLGLSSFGREVWAPVRLPCTER